jgi:hypothetical protein
MLGPIRWRSRVPGRLDPLLVDKPAPYWLLCADCAGLIEHLETNGRHLTQLGHKRNVDDGDIFAYRVD